MTIYSARAAWAYGTLADHLQTRLAKAIFSDDSIALDWPPVEGHPARTTLTKGRDGAYRGASVWADGTPQEQRAAVEGTLYSNGSGHVLVGEEKWENGRIAWIVVQFTSGAAA